MDGENTLFNAVLGAVVTVVLSFLGVSPIIGGAISGYLEGGDLWDGAKVGAYSGLLLVALGAVFVLAIGLMIFVGVAFASPDALLPAGFGIFVVLVILVTSAVTLVGMSALGGAVGSWVKSETDIGQ